MQHSGKVDCAPVLQEQCAPMGFPAHAAPASLPHIHSQLSPMRLHGKVGISKYQDMQLHPDLDHTSPMQDTKVGWRSAIRKQGNTMFKS